MDIEQLKKDGQEAMDRINAHIRTEGRIEEKTKFQGSSNGPKGHFFIDGMKFVCWDENIWDKFKEGDDVKVAYKDISNEYNNKTYVNHTIREMKYLNEQEEEPSHSEEEIDNSESSKDSRFFSSTAASSADNKIVGEFFGIPLVEDESVEEIRVPSAFINWISGVKINQNG